MKAWGPDEMWWTRPVVCVGFLHKSQTKQTAAVLLLRKKEGIGNRGTFYKMCVTLRSCHGHQKQGRSEEMSQPRGTWGDGTCKWDLVFWMGSWNGKGTLGETMGVRIKYGVWWVIMYHMWRKDGAWGGMMYQYRFINGGAGTGLCTMSTKGRLCAG